MVSLTGSVDSSAPKATNLYDLIQNNWAPPQAQDAQQRINAAIHITPDAPPPPPPAPPPQVSYMRVQPQPQFRPAQIQPQQPQLSQQAQNYANIFQGNGQPMSDGQFKQSKLDGYNAEMALKQQQQALQPQYEQLWRDYEKSAAAQLLARNNGTANQNSIGSQIASQVLANQGGIMANGGQYGMAAGNQSLAKLRELQAQGISVPPQLIQAAIDQDYLWNMDGDTTGLKGVGSLQYKSMGVAGGSYTGNNDSFAYGASAKDENGNWNQHSGANYFEDDNIGYNRQMLDEIKRGWANDKRYSKDPMGSYIGNGNSGAGTVIQNPYTSNNQKPGALPGISQGPIQGPENPFRDPRGMSRDQKIDEILNNEGGRYLNRNQNILDLHDTALDQLLKFGRGQLSPADQAKLIDSQTGNSTYLPRQGQYDDSLDHPLRGVIDPPGAYERWVPPAQGYDPNQMYDAPKNGYTAGAQTAAAEIAGLPEVKPLNIANPEWDVFSDDTRSWAKPPINEQRFTRETDPWAFNPVTNGVIEGLMMKRAGKNK